MLTRFYSSAARKSAIEAFPVRLVENSKRQSAARGGLSLASPLVKPKQPPEIQPATRVPYHDRQLEESVLGMHQKALCTSPNRMLARDFIHDSLYNDEYGYFSKRAVIFSPPKDIDFPAIKSTAEFDDYVARLYEEYDDAQEEEALQILHTPTE